LQQTQGRKNMLHSIIYLSKSNQYFSDKELDYLTSTSKKKNNELSITGFLIYQKGYFAQYLEGPKENVDLIGEKIKQDNRHDIVVWLENGIDKVNFNEWDMKQLKSAVYRNLDMASFIMEELSLTRHQKTITQTNTIEMWDNISIVARYYNFVQEQKKMAQLIS